MESFDDFSKTVLEEAKRFFEKSQVETTKDGKEAYRHAALVLGYSALEAHINSICDDFLVREDLNVLERSIFSEKKIELKNGEFTITNQLQIFRMEDRIEYLYRKFMKKPLEKTDTWWSGLKEGISLRNSLVHPKGNPKINDKNIESALASIITTIDVLYKAVYKKRYPSYNRKLNSTLTF